MIGNEYMCGRGFEKIPSSDGLHVWFLGHRLG